MAALDYNPSNDPSKYVIGPNGTKYASADVARQQGVTTFTPVNTQVPPTPTVTPVPTTTPVPSVAPAPTPIPAPVPQTTLYAPAAGYNGSSISDFLKLSGQANDFASRQKLATQYGINGYTGSAGQNTQLLNILKGYATGNVTPTGVPNTIVPPAGNGSVQPIPTTALSTGNPELDKLLNAAVSKGNLDSDIAGLLALSAASTDSSKDYDKSAAELTKLMSSLGNESQDLQTAMDAQGVGAAFEQVKELNLKAAQLKGELDSFDAGTISGNEKISDKVQTQSSIEGDQRAYQKQRDLTRIGKAAELSATVALSQAYQGNAQLGLELAQKSVDLKYQPILNEIEVVKTQLGIAQTKMSSEEKKNADIINALLDIRTKEIESEKANKKDIESVAVEAASNGAPLAVITKMRAAPNAAEAAVIGASYIKGNQESVGGGTPKLDVGEIKFTSDDTQRLIASGFTPAQIKSIQSDINSYGLDSVLAGIDNDTQKKAIKNILSGVTPTQEQNQTEFLNRDFLRKQFGDEALKAAASKAGLTKRISGGILGTGLFAKKEGDIDKYLDQLMTSVESYRKAGYTDQEILKQFQKG